MARPARTAIRCCRCLLHGDAAFAGQGVVAECFGLSGLKGHRTGGSIHFIINNQIGFTTNPRYSRSSPYPSDVAKMVEAPIFHCNGDDPEAVVYAAKVATEYRQRFHKPVVIDMLCYRRFGHNEGDEPSFTQPRMYKIIRQHPTTLAIYSKKLVEQGVITEEEIDAAKAEWRARLDEEFDSVQGFKPNKADWLDGRWSGLKAVKEDKRPIRVGAPPASRWRRWRISVARSPRCPRASTSTAPFRRFVDNRRKMIDTGEGVDWATAEALAFGSLVREGHRVRLSGQDVERGTFSQRHSVLLDQETEQRHTPLNHVSEGQAHYEVIKFDALGRGRAGLRIRLLALGAQCAGALGSAVRRFRQRRAGRVRPVHLLRASASGCACQASSACFRTAMRARVRSIPPPAWSASCRCARKTTCRSPIAPRRRNYFHILRRQLKRDFRKPLILMTPKSLLRHKRCVSQDVGNGPRIPASTASCGTTRRRVSAMVQLAKDDKIRRVVLCTGKVYYDLFEEREKRGINDVYLMRRRAALSVPAEVAAGPELSRFKNADVVWCQEEPKNMGSWSFGRALILEWVLKQAGSKVPRARLCRSCRLCGHRDGPDVRSTSSSSRPSWTRSTAPERQAFRVPGPGVGNT